MSHRLASALDLRRSEDRDDVDCFQVIHAKAGLALALASGQEPAARAAAAQALTAVSYLESEQQPRGFMEDALEALLEDLDNKLADRADEKGCSLALVLIRRRLVVGASIGDGMVWQLGDSGRDLSWNQLRRARLGQGRAKASTFRAALRPGEGIALLGPGLRGALTPAQLAIEIRQRPLEELAARMSAYPNGTNCSVVLVTRLA